MSKFILPSGRMTFIQRRLNVEAEWGYPVLIAQNLTLNSEVAPNYKYIFGLYRGPPLRN